MHRDDRFEASSPVSSASPSPVAAQASSVPKTHMHSVGSRLHRARENRGLSLEQIAQLTKISCAYLQAIEADNFRLLPAPVFARGFVRSYGTAVGLDPDELVRALPLSIDVAAPQPLLTDSTGRGRGLIRRLSQVLLTLVAVSMLLAAWWKVGTN